MVKHTLRPVFVKHRVLARWGRPVSAASAVATGGGTCTRPYSAVKECSTAAKYHTPFAYATATRRKGLNWRNEERCAEYCVGYLPPPPPPPPHTHTPPPHTRTHTYAYTYAHTHSNARTHKYTYTCLHNTCLHTTWSSSQKNPSSAHDLGSRVQKGTDRALLWVGRR